MPNAGWVKIFRKVKGHWLYQDKPFDRYHAWEDILLNVNHEKKKFLLGNNVITLEAGQMVTSLRKLGERWGWGAEKVRRFLNLLVSDGMLEIECDTSKTVITVANWAFYQSRDSEVRHERDTSETQIDTNKKIKNVKNDEKDIPPTPPEGESAGGERNKQLELQEVWDNHSLPPMTSGAIAHWVRYKREKREAYHPSGLNSLLSQAEKHAQSFGDGTVAELIENCMANNYKGIIWDRLEKPKVKDVPSDSAQNKPCKNAIEQTRKVLERLTGRECVPSTEVHPSAVGLPID